MAEMCGCGDEEDFAGMDDSEVEAPTKGVRFAAPQLKLRGVLVRRPRKPRPALAALPPTSADPSVLKGLKLRKAGAVEDERESSSGSARDRSTRRCFAQTRATKSRFVGFVGFVVIVIYRLPLLCLCVRVCVVWTLFCKSLLCWFHVFDTSRRIEEEEDMGRPVH